MPSMMQNSEPSWQGAPKAPTGRITQTDVASLNDAVAALAKAEDPRRFEDASKKLADLLPRFESAGESEYAAEAMFWLAYCYEKTNRKQEAAVFYDQLVGKYPQTRAAEEAKARRQRLQFNRPPETPKTP
jgi:hypothetical protein